MRLADSVPIRSYAGRPTGSVFQPWLRWTWGRSLGFAVPRLAWGSSNGFAVSRNIQRGREGACRGGFQTRLGCNDTIPVATARYQTRAGLIPAPTGSLCLARRGSPFPRLAWGSSNGIAEPLDDPADRRADRPP